MKRIILALSIFALSLPGCSDRKTESLDYEALNRQARQDYLVPVRPGYEGVNPFWNEFAVKFIYAPAFDFKEVDGATTYLFTAETNGKEYSFKADSPTAPLTPIWNDIPVGETSLVVEALDSDGKVIGKAGERRFLRDYPFRGPYPRRLESYRSSAKRALEYIHEMPEVIPWRTRTVPDAGKPVNTKFDYLCKILGNLIRCETLLARLEPALKDEALATARNAAAYLIAESLPEGSPAAFFPPTYDERYGTNEVVTLAENKGKTMVMEAVEAAQGFLDLFDATGERIYYDRAYGITDTYRRLQGEDGSWPIKMDIRTAEPVNNAKATPSALLLLVRRWEDQYGVEEFSEMRVRAEKFMEEISLKKFDLTGQFEDVGVNVKPYQNLTNTTANAYACYLLSKKSVTPSESALALDLVRFCEDQFTYWGEFPGEFDARDSFYTPGVVEQYQWRAVVDASVAGVAQAFLYEYLDSGDKLWLAKAEALADQITVVQDRLTGKIPTTWRREPDNDRSSQIWVNCTYKCALVLMKFAEVLE